MKEMQFSTEDPPVAGGTSPGRSECVEQLERILQSPQFRESHQLQRFLRYIVEETLEGHEDGLKEYAIGSRVFSRRQDYDPRHDAIVRVQATQLRKKLDGYYSTLGASDAIIIALPRGGYVPVFRLRATEPPAAVAVRPAEQPVKRAPSHGRFPALAGGFLAGLIVAAAALLLWQGQGASTQSPGSRKIVGLGAVEASDFPELWAPFGAGSRNLVTFGVPLFYGASGMYVRDTRVNSPGQESAGSIFKWAKTFNVNPIPNDDLYTGVGEAIGVHLVSSFLASRGAGVQVANSRSIGPSDMSDRNLVVISSLRFRTLLSDLRLPTEFEFVPKSPESIVNRHPLPDEKKIYEFRNGAGIATSYALVSLWRGTTPERRILHIGGVHTWATQAATEFLLRPESLRALRREFQKDRASRTHGTPTPYFQILLRVEGRGNQFQAVEYVTHHYLPADAHAVRP